MATLNYGTKELVCKIVYYGPAMGGKTTNLQQIHLQLPKTGRSDLTSLATKEDRTLFFDLLPVDMGKIGDYYVKIQLYTVPGQVHYNATRRVVLNGVDGLVMVYDSQPERMDENKEALRNLTENLASYGLKPEEVPTVFQFNKRDVPNAVFVEKMSQELNPDGRVPEFEATAIEGAGVMPTLRKVASMVFARIEEEMKEEQERLKTGGLRNPWRRPSGTKSHRNVAVATPAQSREVLVPTDEPTPKEVAQVSTGRLRQVCDLRSAGVKMGFAVAEVGTPDLNGELAVTLDLRPMVGTRRQLNLNFHEVEKKSLRAGETTIFATRQTASEEPFKLWRVHVGQGVDRVYLSVKASLGRTLAILPEGENRLPEES